MFLFTRRPSVQSRLQSFLDELKYVAMKPVEGDFEKCSEACPECGGDNAINRCHDCTNPDGSHEELVWNECLDCHYCW